MSKILQKVMKSEKGIKELLIEMKDLSELAVDLAYSSLLFNSREIALEVGLIEKEIDEKRMEIEARSILSCPSSENIDAMVTALRVAGFIDRVSDAAQSIADLIVEGTGSGAFVAEVFKETDETIAKIEVSTSGKISDLTVDQLEDSTSVTTIAIKRKNKWVYDPKPLFRVKPGDIMIVVGPNDDIKKFKSMNR